MRKLSFILLALLLCQSLAWCLTWPQALQLAKDNNPELRSAQKLLDSSGWTYRRAYGAFLPQLSANASAGQTSVASFGANANYSYGLNASIDIFNASDLFSLRSAYAEYEYNQANYNLTAANILYDVRQAFISQLIAQANVETQERILARRKENTRMIALRYNSGIEDKGNLMRTQADEANASYNLSSAQRDLRLAKLNLSQLLGTPVDSAEAELQITGSPQPDYESLMLSAPAYLAAKYQLEAAEIQQQSTLNEFLPAVTLSGGYRKSGSSWPPTTDSNSVSLNLSYALFPGGTNFIDAVINNINMDKAKEDFAKSVNDTRFSVTSAYEGLNDALEGLEASRVLLAATAERSNISQEKYIDGLITYDEWYRTEDEYIGAQSGFLNAQKSALTADAAWQKSFGGYVK